MPLVDIATLRQIRKLQQRFEIGFCRPDRSNWPPEVEVVVGTRQYHELARWFVHRKPFFDPDVLNTYHRLLRRHMGHKTITAFLSVDPEDGWISMAFSVYGCRALRADECIHPMHARFLAAIYNEGLQYRQMDDHITLRVLDQQYRPLPPLTGVHDVPVSSKTISGSRRRSAHAAR